VGRGRGRYPVIARVWTARTTPERAPAYADHLRTRVLPQLRALDGYTGASLLRRDADVETELIVVTRWRSLDAVRAFAGDDLEAAVVEPEAAAVLTRYDTRVRHYEIVVEDA
jgi:heme-degrading monooxygenase HmoA